MNERPLTETGAELIVDLGAIAENYRRVADKAAGAACGAVVKADAYGLGLGPVAGALSGAGARIFFVAHLCEARELRAALPGATIYVLNGLAPKSAAIYEELDARPVLCAPQEVEEWAAYCKPGGAKRKAAVQVDTGMNRLGLSLAQAEALAAASGGPLTVFDLCLVMSHFVSSERPDDPVNTRQIELFERVREWFPGIPASLANSSGIFLDQRPHFDLVRPGYALYGGNPLPGKENPMRPAVTLKARISQTRTVRAGETIGYNGQWTAAADCRVAVASIGYADGFPRAAGGIGASIGGHGLLAGQHCPIVGRVSMDPIVLDISAVPENEAQRGDYITFLNEDLNIDKVAEAGGTIGYDILTRLGARFTRRYVSPGRD